MLLLAGCAAGPTGKPAQTTAAQQVLKAYHVPDLLAQAAPAVSRSLDKNLPDTVSTSDRQRLSRVVSEAFEPQALQQDIVERLRERAADEGARVVVVCAAIEAEIAQLDDDDKGEFLADLGLSEPGLDRVATAAYELLGLQTYFTAGPQEVRAWTVKRGATAPQAAGVIHTDFEKGFIRAEVVAYDDYVACNGEAGAREAGKWRLEGKEYRVAEGDVMHFRFNV